MEIREATLEDNDTLQALQAQCPQGISLVVSTVNTPDFFARAKAYESYKIFVACEDSRIIGSGACAFRNGIINGNTERLGYEFQYFVSPDFRRKGLAGQLRNHIEKYLIQEGAALSYALVMEGNVPSMRLLESYGFHIYRRLTMRTLPVRKEKQVDSAVAVRSATSDDLSSVSQLLNDTWQKYEWFHPTTVESLNQCIDRIPAFHLDDILLLEDRNGISACLGVWDWSRVMRVTVERLSRKMRWMGRLLVLTGIMPQFIKPGDTMKQVMLTMVGYRSVQDLSFLLRHLNNQALRKGIEQIFYLCEKGDPMLKCSKGFVHIDTGMQLYVKPLRSDLKLGAGPVFIDGIDV
jgi:GNAT superfamily N-acetyltransferase